MRYLDIHEDGQLDEAQVADWAKQVGQLAHCNSLPKFSNVERGHTRHSHRVAGFLVEVFWPPKNVRFVDLNPISRVDLFDRHQDEFFAVVQHGYDLVRYALSSTPASPRSITVAVAPNSHPFAPDNRASGWTFGMAAVEWPSYFDSGSAPKKPQDLIGHDCINLGLPTHARVARECEKRCRAPDLPLGSQAAASLAAIDRARAPCGSAFVSLSAAGANPIGPV